jgi:DNA-directed RNA polymerase specialized sigma subunit
MKHHDMVGWWVERYGPRCKTFDHDDLFQEGYIALHRAALRYDPVAIPCRFTTYGCITLLRHFEYITRRDRAWLTGGIANHPKRVGLFRCKARIDVQYPDDDPGHLTIALKLVERLGERERAILHFRLQGETLAEIGERFGISKERVRQLEARSVRKIREWSRIA